MRARRPPGQVRDSILKVMKGKGEMSTRDVLAGVRRDLNQEISSSSVRSYLRLNDDKTFERTGHGRYRLRDR